VTNLNKPKFEYVKKAQDFKEMMMNQGLRRISSKLHLGCWKL